MFDQHHSGDTVRTVEVVRPFSLRARSAARKLVHAAGIAAALVLVGAIRADATSCTYLSESFSGEGCSAGTHGGAVFGFGTDYTLELMFENRIGTFTITVDNEEKTQSDFNEEEQMGSFPDYVCVPIAGGDTCVQFAFSGDITPSDTTWKDFFQVYIHWDNPTPFDAESENPQNRIKMLHAQGEGNNVFNFDMSFNNDDDYTPYNPDPGVGGRDNMFSLMAAFQGPDATVPEPASLILLGSGVSAMLYRRRAQKAQRD